MCREKRGGDYCGRFGRLVELRVKRRIAGCVGGEVVKNKICLV